MKTKACILESGNNASDIYEYVMLAIAYRRSLLPDLYTLMFGAYEVANLTEEQEAILTAHLAGDYRNATEFYAAMAKLEA